jgi:hypothetical protein
MRPTRTSLLASAVRHAARPAEPRPVLLMLVVVVLARRRSSPDPTPMAGID